MGDRRKDTLHDISAHYDDDRRQFDKVVSLWVYYVTRPMSFPITWVFLRMGLSANAATLFSMVVGLTSCTMFAVGSWEAAVLGAVLYNGFLVVDSVDGNIARLLKTSSKKGEFFDALVGDLVGVLLLPCIAVGLVIHEHPVSSTASHLLPIQSGYILVVASLIATLCYQSAILLFQRKKVILITAKPKKPNDFGVSSSALKSFALMLVRNLTGFPFLAPAVLVFSLLDMLWILVVYVTLCNVVLFVASFAYGITTIFMEKPVLTSKG